MNMHLRTIAAIAVGSSFLIGGCARKEYVRGSQEPGIDSAAMSTGLDKQDIQQMLKENLNNLRGDGHLASGSRKDGGHHLSVF